MAEGSRHAAILIATSYQALNRAVRGSSQTLFADCTVMVLFASLYVEATVNHIVEHIGKANQMTAFLNRPFPGMQDKIGWFYNEFVARSKAKTRKQMYDNGIEVKLRRKFPGFAQLYRFRNSISHGEIHPLAASLRTALHLRQRAKDLATDLYDIAADAGHPAPRLITYRQAIAALPPSVARAYGVRSRKP